MGLKKLLLVLGLRTFLCTIATGICYYVIVAMLGQTGSHTERWVVIALTATVGSVIWVPALVRPLVELSIVAYDGMRALVWAGESGRYYAFGGQQIRVIDVNGEPWIVEADVFLLIDPATVRHINWRKLPPEHYGQIPDTSFKGFSEAGIARLLGEKNDPESRRVRQWLNRDVFKPAATKKRLSSS
jgi:hypothetical protein